MAQLTLHEGSIVRDDDDGTFVRGVVGFGGFMWWQPAIEPRHSGFTAGWCMDVSASTRSHPFFSRSYSAFLVARCPNSHRMWVAPSNPGWSGATSQHCATLRSGPAPM